MHSFIITNSGIIMYMIKQKVPSPNYNFYINADTSGYKGQWIAIAKKKIIAHGKDAEQVYKKANKKFKNEEISLAKVPEEQTLILRLLK